MSHVIQVPSQLSSHLRALRKSRRLSQVDLGKRLGLSQARIARIEGDPLSISVDQLLRVLSALGVRATLDPMPSGPGSAIVTGPATHGAASGGAASKKRGARGQEQDW